jgi:RNase adapter protein RapZ
VLYLEANTPTLLRRFSETRRRHPLAGEDTLPEAIEHERALLEQVATLGSRIDTSDLQPRVLQNWIRDLLGVGAGALTLLFESFSYKQGIPLDADWVLDARMVANPHYDAALRPLTGRDAPVIAYLSADASAQRWLDDVRTLLARWLPEIVRENRSHVTVAIGCTGGRHRSVYFAEKLAAAFRSDWRVLVRHRGLAQEAVEK